MYKKYWWKNIPEGGHPGAQAQGGAHPPGRALQACGPPGPPATLTMTPYIPICQEKTERRVHRVSRYGAAATSCSSSGGLIWSPFGAPEGGNRNRRHHQPSSITNFMMLTT